MLTLIMLTLIIYWIIERFGQSAGSWAIGIIGLILIVMFCKAWCDDSKAYSNRVKYWKKGGPDCHD